MPSLRRFAPALIGLAFVATPPAMATDDPSINADRLLEAAKKATGDTAWDKLLTLDDRGKLKGPGLDGTYDSLTDMRRLLYVQSSVLGPTTGVQGWDGKTAWSVDSSGQVRIEKSQEAVAAAIEQSYRSAYAFFWPARWPATRAYVGQKQADGVSYDVVRVTPRGAEPFEIWFDPATHLIAREADVTGAQQHTQIMADYREVAGVMLPFLNRDSIGDPKYDMVAATDTLKAGGSLPPQKFGPPPPPKEPDPFPAGQNQVRVPFRLSNNHIHFDVSINGLPPQPFIFDTGAVAILDTAHAAAMNIKPEGALPGAGFGEGTTAIGVAKVRSLELGGFKLSNQMFYTIDLSAGRKFEGVDSAGLLGCEIPKRAVMTIDYADGVITLTRPSAFKPPPGALVMPFTFNEHVPMIEASVDGISGEFEIDTGNSTGLDLMGPFADANHLAERYHATRSATTGYGAGGPSKSLLARAGELKIGSIVISEPVALIEGGKRGAGAAARTAGNIGGGLLRRFTVTFDYGHQMLYLQPNAAFGSPDVFDRSGLRLMRDPDGAAEIADVTPGSGAGAAGLKTGERIVAIDGTSAASISLGDLRDRLKGSPGTKVILSVVHDGDAATDVVVMLNDQI